ncbi:hypothetical protein QYM36_009341 [Artemia franciscana]|uniref:3'-5' exonuclease domain-containing protein n=1 Tax=Artemia franciscana TaxID=6661 RepID=A0AA88HSX5_ARTSF|nr:hypothetical protein QYM36_009341 [Artemia franciscana]
MEAPKSTSASCINATGITFWRMSLSATQPPRKILPKITEILEDVNIVKLGVGILGDALRLKQQAGISLRGSLDLSHLYISIHESEKEQSGLGLARLSAKVIGIPIVKNLSIVCSDWEAPYLTNSQIEYASLDAFISLPIFCELFRELHRISIKNGHNHDDSESWTIARKSCKKYLDLKPKKKKRKMKKRRKSYAKDFLSEQEENIAS